MNKKFSTLVASLLLTSAFSVYSADAKPVLATPTQVETRATLPAEVEEAVVVNSVFPELAIGGGVASKVFPGFTNNARLVVGNFSETYITNTNRFVKFDDAIGVNQPTFSVYPSASGTTPAGAENFYWSLQNGQLVDNAGHVFTAKGSSTYFEVIPIISGVEADAPTYWFVLGSRDSDGKLHYVTFENASSPVAGSYFGLTEQITNSAVFCSVEAEYNLNVSESDLNDVYGEKGAFTMSISSKVDEDADVLNADVFDGKLTACNTSGYYYQLKNEAGKFIVFDMNDQTTSDANTLPGKFKVVDNPNASGLLSYFCVSKADNGSDDIIVKVDGQSVPSTSVVASTVYRLYIANTGGTYALSIADYYGIKPTTNTIDVIDWAKVTIGDNKIVDLREFLTGDFYTVDFVKAAVENNNNAYKKNGRLAIRENDKADYVEAASLYEKAPEAQWAVSGTVTAGVNEGKPYFNEEITLTNRENPSVSVTIEQLRRVDGIGLLVEKLGTSTTATAGIEEGDIIRINAVANHDKHDGYEVFSDNDLKNETYYLGQIRQAEGEDINVYWAENHAASHQIGATVEQAKATKWNLSLVKKDRAKDHESEIDSVLVISELQKWNPVKNRIDAKKDTLVILPYAFQNRSNSEFAEFNNGTNLKYYQCNVYDKDEAKVYKYGTDAMFALKRKADVNGERVYNYVALKARKATAYSDKGYVPVVEGNNYYANEKVYQENSTEYGTWKNMKMYDADANSLMFVTKVDAPEYRKLVADAALDTISIYRGDNDHQVVYEKAGVSLNGRTLSFLNVDNDVQFGDINPALYADSAYVNRGENTRWQYLLAVNVEHHEGYYCEDHGFRPEDTCEHSVWVSYNTGRYLINMIDTANVYGQTAGIHNNPYINETEEGNQCAKLSFVNAIHVLADGVAPEMADKLYVINGTEEGDTTVLDLGTDALNVAKFAFKYTDSMESDEFKIQTLWMDYNPAKYGDGSNEDPLKNTTEEGYLRWVNGCIVVDDEYAKGDVFNMNEDETRTPTANETIEDATSAVSVVATEGGVIVKGAEGKNVIVSTILGKVVANEVINSDNETIAAPAGIVVVSVDGESFKVAVK